MLNDIKTILGISGGEQDELISSLYSMTTQRLITLLGTGVEAVPDDLSYIVTEVTVARFNRIGSEGVSSHSVEGETMTWSQNDFDPYMDDINSWLDSKSKSKGRVKFL